VLSKTTPTNAAQPPASRAGLARLLRPGVRLMRKLTLAQRMALTAVSLFVPLLLLMGVAVGRIWQDYGVAARELQGTDVHAALTKVVVQTQRLRELAYADLVAGTSRPDGLAEGQRALADASRQLLAKLQADQDGAFGAVLPALSERLARVQKAPAAEVLDNEAGALVAELYRLAQHNGEVSQLLLDPVAASYMLMDIVVAQSIPMLEAVSSSRELGLQRLRATQASTADRLALLGAATVLNKGTDEVQWLFEAYTRAGGATPGSWTGAVEASTDYARYLQSSFSRDVLEGDESRHRELASTVHQRVLAVHDDSLFRLQALLQERMKDALTEIGLLCAAFAAMLAGLAYLVVVSAATVRGALGRLLQGTDAVAAGDLTRSLEVQGRDEVAQIATSLERMTRQLSWLVAAIRSDASQVSMAGNLLADGSAQLSSRTEQQGDCLTTASAAIRDLAQAVAHNATEASALDTVSARLQAQAEQASAAMADTVTAMRAVEQSSEQVSKIVSVLDDLAFQTGMLALNASIEAAKAGESGQGFSIVATEVRQLALRSAAASEEIRQLVTTSTDEVRQAGNRMVIASQATHGVGQGIAEMSQRLERLSTSSQGQSNELASITAMIGNLDDITRDNARLVEQTATASSQLLQRAQALDASVASMRLRHGSADEAKALAKAALAHWGRVGRDQALADFHLPSAGFIDRDLYVVVFDRQGVYAAFGLRPDMRGSTVHDLPGLDGRQLLTEVLAAADAGGGWIRYTMVNPSTGEQQIKDAWVEPAGEHGEVLLCGAFRNAEPQLQNRKSVSWATADRRTAVAGMVAEPA
jgi:methyl-accepting chemotaxis protein